MDKEYGIGVDFGTSNSVVATFDGTSINLMHLEASSALMPSAVHISNRLKSSTGQEAIDMFVSGNVGRKVELVSEQTGQASILIGARQGGRPEVLTEKVYSEPRVDAGIKGRLFLGTKRLLGRPEFERLSVFNERFRLVALVTPLLERIRKHIESNAIEASTCCAGHPVQFEGGARQRTSLALARLREAYSYAGMPKINFVPEPVAATLSYLYRTPTSATRHVLTVDFGGGTLDLCVLKSDGNGDMTVLGTHGVSIGGDHIDQQLFKVLLFPLLGEGEIWRRQGENRLLETPFPFERYEPHLLNWTTTYLLNQNRYTAPIYKCLESDDLDRRTKFQRLLQHIQSNYGYLVFDHLKNLKAALSSSSEARLDIPELDIEQRVTREQFEHWIEGSLTKINEAVSVALSKFGVQEQEIDVVLRTGGSSLIPAFRRLLARRFDQRVIEHDPFTSVAAGLAIADYYEISGLRGVQYAFSNT